MTWKGTAFNSRPLSTSITFVVALSCILLRLPSLLQLTLPHISADSLHSPFQGHISHRLSQSFNTGPVFSLSRTTFSTNFILWVANGNSRLLRNIDSTSRIHMTSQPNECTSNTTVAQWQIYIIKIILLFSQLTNLQHIPSSIELPTQHFGYVPHLWLEAAVVLLLHFCPGIAGYKIHSEHEDRSSCAQCDCCCSCRQFVSSYNKLTAERIYC
jgi:hypothetical protein